MGENTHISWADHTFNPWMGCTKVSPACDGCYAEAMMDHRYGRVKWGNNPRVRTGPNNWNEPRRWARKAREAGTRPFVFCASLADVFDNQVDPQWRVDLFSLMDQTPELIYLLLTKRPQNIVKMCADAGRLPRNAALGTTTEDQTRADINIPALLHAASSLKPLFTFVSIEPILGPIDLTKWLWGRDEPCQLCPGDADCGCGYQTRDRLSGETPLDWVITGGETDQGEHTARPADPEWIRSLRDQCENADVPFHHKQWGSWHSDALRYTTLDGVCPPPDMKIGPKKSGRKLDGIIHDARPRVA